jgi:capsular polysaccharide transport system permease protein
MTDEENGDDEFDPASRNPGDVGGGNKNQGPGRNFAENWRNRGIGRQAAHQRREKTLQAPAPPTLPTGTAHQVELLLAMRQNRLRRFLLRLGLFVALPTFIVWFYTALIATPRYVCNFEVTYQAYQPSSTLSGGLTQSILGTSVADSIDYGTLIYEYIRSAALAEQVDKKLNLRQHFSSDKIDWFSRLGKNASQSAFLSYWLHHVSVSEGFGGYLTVEVQGFDPAFTLLLAQTINADADAMMDSLNVQARDDEIKSANVQLDIAGAALKNADDALTSFRNTHGDLDPNLMATQLATIVGTLESQLALLRAQLQQAQANLQPGASQIVQLNLQVNALEKQIASERQRLSDSTGQTSYSNTVVEYQDLLSNQQFANTTYQSSQQALVLALSDAASKQNYVVDFVPPILPSHPTMPNPLVSSFTVFLAFLSAYGIFNLLFAAFRDQSGL